MITPQNGIFAQGTHSHYFLELDLQPGVTPHKALRSLRRLREPEVSAGGANFVIAFGADLWRGIAPDHAAFARPGIPGAAAELCHPDFRQL